MNLTNLSTADRRQNKRKGIFPVNWVQRSPAAARMPKKS